MPCAELRKTSADLRVMTDREEFNPEVSHENSKDRSCSSNNVCDRSLRIREERAEVRSRAPLDAGAVPAGRPGHCAGKGVDPGHSQADTACGDLHLQGIGLEVEVRDVLFGHSSSQPSNLAEKTLGGGVTYTWRRFRNARPYGKAIWEFGDAEKRRALAPTPVNPALLQLSAAV